MPVLADLDLDVEEGDFLALMGPSGSGKTTLLNLIAGLDRPTAGEVIVHDQNLGLMSDGQVTRWRSNNVGFIFQMYNLIPVMTAFENVELPLLLTNLSRKRRRENVMTALRIVGLSGREDHYPRQLSGGQEQRVAIAHAIVTDPYLVVADEPTGDLDRVEHRGNLGIAGPTQSRVSKDDRHGHARPSRRESRNALLNLDKGKLVGDVAPPRDSEADRAREWEAAS